MSAASKQSGEPRLGSPLAEEEEEDLYVRLKALRRQLELVGIREECIKNKHKNLKRELRWEVKRLQSVPLVVGHLLEMIDQNTPSTGNSIFLLSQSEKPDVTYNDISGCDIQKQEIREFVELPLIHHELYRQIGIDPPRGVLLYGPPGTGKTMFAKALAHHTTAAFIRVVGSEVLGSPFEKFHTGARMARMFFCPAKGNTPSIVFMDEVDAIAADREVQRILLELLNPGGSYVKVSRGIGCPTARSAVRDMRSRWSWPGRRRRSRRDDALNHVLSSRNILPSRREVLCSYCSREMERGRLTKLTVFDPSLFEDASTKAMKKSTTFLGLGSNSD
ncbi:unnamed protein product [Spirodela intermedia]|uniref:AAA+ ATPase domain-containing protein n=1 Tax=Spirodela intermedia TaxID=51605 RepID=A0A7I8KNF5_SPIIN|nr:unnamed protein product [Spirodela intermedia]